MRDEPDRSGRVVQEILIWEYERDDQARKALCALRASIWGPVGKLPCTLWLWRGRFILGVESRFRFPKYHRELRQRVERFDEVDVVTCK